MPDSPHRGWHRRGYLPHLDEPGRVQAITLRLADSLPRALVESWEGPLSRLSPEQAIVERARHVAETLDRGYGHCWLQKPALADLVEQALFHFNATRYELLAWCVMPNHVHALISLIEGFPMEKVVQSWKSYTGVRCNRILGRTGAFWARDYFDRFIRDEEHLGQAATYIENNPTMAGLAATPEKWRWSSAYHRAREIE